MQECIFYKLEKVHLFNASPIISRIYSLVKPFIKKDLQEQIIFHSSHEDLADLIGKDHLPNDYGGNAGKVEELYNSQLKRHADNVDVLKEFEKFCM